MHKAAEATKAELENLYKKHNAYNRLRTDPAIREVTATTLWLHPTLLADIQALAEKRGIYPNAPHRRGPRLGYVCRNVHQQ